MLANYLRKCFHKGEEAHMGLNSSVDKQDLLNYCISKHMFNVDLPEPGPNRNCVI